MYYTLHDYSYIGGSFANSLSLHRTNRNAAALPFTQEGGSDGRYEEGPMLVIESEHPYRHNCHEFTTVQVPGAVSYKISFTEETRTEAVYDFIKVSQYCLYLCLYM